MKAQRFRYAYYENGADGEVASRIFQRHLVATFASAAVCVGRCYAGVGNAGAITHGKLSEEKTIRYW